MLHNKNNTRVKFIAAVAFAALLFCVLYTPAQAAASVHKYSFLSQLLAARGFETRPNAQENAALILRSGIVTDPVDNLASPVTRRDALRWAIQSLGLSVVANILADVNPAALDLRFNDLASLSSFERGSLIVATRMVPPIFVNDAANFGPGYNISQDEANVILGNVRSASQHMRLELRFSPAPGMELVIFREGTFSAIPRWRVFVDGFDERSEVDAQQRFFAAQGFSMESNNPNFEWRLSSELLDDYAQVRRLLALAESRGKSARVIPSLRNTNLENQPFYWALLTINPGSFRLEPIIAPTGVTALAPLSAMVDNSNASAAINAGFFGISRRNTGAPIGTLQINNIIGNRPFQGRTNLGWSRDNRAAFGEVSWSGRMVLEEGGQLTINSVNQFIRGDVVVLYNALHGGPTPTHDRVVEIIIENGRSVGINTSGGTIITPGRYVIAGYGTMADMLRRYITRGMAIRVEGTFNSGDPHWNSMDNIIQAGPFLIRSGQINIEPEGFNNSILNLRHPRSAMGLTEDGRWFFFVGDGRNGMHSAGFTLQEVATILRRNGAAYALNLDGGGSSQLMMGNRIFNSPSEKRERPISYGVGAMRIMGR